MRRRGCAYVARVGIQSVVSERVAEHGSIARAADPADAEAHLCHLQPVCSDDNRDLRGAGTSSDDMAHRIREDRRRGTALARGRAHVRMIVGTRVRQQVEGSGCAYRF